MEIKTLNKRLSLLLNETKKDELKVGDIVYIRGDHGLYNDKYEITKITDSHDEEIKTVESGSYLFKPDEDAKPIALLKDIETGETRAWNIDPESRYYADPIELVSNIEGLGISSLDLDVMSNSLKDALKDKGINTDLEIVTNEEKGKAFPSLKIEGKTNLVDQAGVWKYAVKEMTLDSWGSAYISTAKKNVQFSLHFSYQHTRGGSNGCEIGYATFNLVDKTWNIELN